MDPLILLQHARDAGLRIGVAGTSLKIRGPRKAEPLVRLLAEHKAQVLDALRKVQEVQKVQGTEGRGTNALPANCPDCVLEGQPASEPVGGTKAGVLADWAAA